MKTINIHHTLLSTIISFVIFSCVQDGDFSVPNIDIKEPNITVNSSIMAVKKALQQEFKTSGGNLIYTFNTNENNPTFIEGYVISSDATGNFYKKLIIQDKTKNPTGGIALILNETSLSETYAIGRKIYIKLDGLSVSYNDGGNNRNNNPNDDINPTNTTPGKYILGILNKGTLDNIPSTSIKNHLFRSKTLATIIPTPFSISSCKNVIDDSYINTSVVIENAQFKQTELSKTFAGEANDEFDGFRNIIECATKTIIPLQTSTFSSFKSNILPQGKGTIRFVLSKDFRAEFLVAIINTPSDINFIEATRCDAPVQKSLECPAITTTTTPRIIYEEDFQSITKEAQLQTMGWTNMNICGAEKFERSIFNGDSYLKISAFGTGEIPLDAWLITPAINLDTSTDEELSFQISANFESGKALTAYITNEYTGDPITTKWISLNANIPIGNNGFGSFETSKINISCLSGKVYIGFNYFGADGGTETRYHIDNIKITEFKPYLLLSNTLK